MAELLDCANELLVEIYQSLDNIDDALHLARCSKRMYAVFDTSRFHIMKSIIVSIISQAMAYLQLCLHLAYYNSSLPAFIPTTLCSVTSWTLSSTFL